MKKYNAISPDANEKVNMEKNGVTAATTSLGLRGDRTYIYFYYRLFHVKASESKPRYLCIRFEELKLFMAFNIFPSL